MNNDIKLFKDVLTKFRFVDPVPPDIQKNMIYPKRELLINILKQLNRYNPVFGIILFIFFLAKMGVVTPQLLRKKRKYAILMTFVLAAILTPPDVVTQCMMAGPLIILYEIGILVATIAWKAKEKKKKEADDDEETDEVEEANK